MDIVWERLSQSEKIPKAEEHSLNYEVGIIINIHTFLGL
jgi:hypothetical protein